jgi:hypothetical protein
MKYHAPIGGTGMPGRLRSGGRKAGEFTRLLPLLLALLAAAPAPAEEQLELEGMAVFGNRELPKALFIVPWKDPQAGLAPERPVDSLVDQALQPVDPDVFRRKLEYYDTVHKTN